MYIPIFSKDLENFLNKKVALIGKIINIKEERKYIDILLLDPFGYFTARSFEPREFEIFSSVIILGKVKEFKGQKYVVANYFLKLSQREEIFWRSRHLYLYKKLSKSKRLAKKETEKEDTELKNKEEIYIEKEKKDLLPIGGKGSRNMVIKAIKELDTGDGVSTEQLVDYLGIDKNSVEKIVEELLIMGEIYEVSPNKFKVVE